MIKLSRLKNIKFDDWVLMQEASGGFYDPKLKRKVQFYEDLCPQGKVLAKEK